MFLRKMSRIWLTLLAFFVLGVAAQATPILGTAVDAANYSGSRNVTAGGLTGSGAYASSFAISWAVTLQDGHYHYEYTLSNLDKNLSHMLLQVSDTFTDENLFNVSNDGVSAPATYSPDDPGRANVGLPASIYGLKIAGIAGDTFTLSFDSDRAPMWGDFYAKSGVDHGTWSYIFNNGLVNPASESILDFIAVPDTQSAPPVVPEPATLTLGTLGLGLLGWTRRRRHPRA